MDASIDVEKRPETKDAVLHRSPTGRAVVLERGERGAETLKVVGRGGDVELTVRLTDAGPVLSFKGARIELESTGAVAVDCEDFEVRARRDVRVAAGGALVQRAGGEMRVEAESDLWLDGKMVLVNCDRERELAEREGRDGHEGG